MIWRLRQLKTWRNKDNGYGSYLQGSYSRYWAPLSVPTLPNILASSLANLYAFLLLPSALSLGLLSAWLNKYHWEKMEFAYQRVPGSFLLVVMDLLVESVQYFLFFWMNNSLSNDFRFQMLSITRLLYSSHACSVRALDNMNISSGEGEVRIVAWLVGYTGAYLSLYLLSIERVTLPTSSSLYPNYSFPIIVHLSSDGETWEYILGCWV